MDTKHRLSTTVFYYPLEQDRDLTCLADCMISLACQSLHVEATWKKKTYTYIYTVLYLAVTNLNMILECDAECDETLFRRMS